MARLAFSGVRKNYGQLQALQGIDLEIGEGELLVLVGPSGSGKTTALRLVAGLERVTAGTIHIGARDVTGMSPAQRNVSMVFQSYALFPHLTVAENIGFGLRARRVRRREADARVSAAAELVGCNHLTSRKPFELSGGERQRVALARALAREPDVFLLDEPLSNLDAQLRVETRANFKRLHRRLESTAVYVTHDQVEALMLGDRVAVLNEGVVQQVASPHEIYRHPVNRFVATFIGSPAMNIVTAVVERDAILAGPFRIDTAGEDGRLVGRRVALGVRPEHVNVAPDGDGWPARVELVESAGDETVLHLIVEGQLLVASVGPKLRPAVGATVRAKIERSRIYLFDAESGVTLVTPL